MMKKISLLLVVLALILSVGMVAAADDVSSANDSQMTVSTDDNAETIGNFTVLQYYIDELPNKISFEEIGYDGFKREASESPLIINDDLKIDGNGGFIDANNGTMFIINGTGNTLTLFNITLKNANGTIIDFNETGIDGNGIIIENSIIRSNTGLLLNNTSFLSEITLDTVLIVNNQIQIIQNGTMQIIDSLFLFNKAIDNESAIINNRNTLNMLDNRAIRNAGLFINNSGEMNLTDNKFRYMVGGILEDMEDNLLIYNCEDAVLNMTNNVITNTTNTPICVFNEGSLILTNNTLGDENDHFDIVTNSLDKITTDFNCEMYESYTHYGQPTLIICSITDDNDNEIFCDNVTIYVSNEDYEETYELDIDDDVFNKYKKYGVYVALTEESIDLPVGTYNITTPDNETVLNTLTVCDPSYKAQGNISVEAFNSFYSYNQYFNITLEIVPTIYMLNNNIKVQIYRGYKLVEEFEISPVYLEESYIVNVNKEIGKYLPLSDNYRVFVSYEDEFNNITRATDTFAIIDPTVRYDTKLNVTATNVKVGDNAYIYYNLDAKNPYKNITITIYKGLEVVGEFNVSPNSTYVELYDTTEGIYNVVAKYDGDFYNKRAIATTSFIISKNVAQIEVIAKDVTEDENVTVTVNFNATTPTDEIIIRVYRANIVKVLEYKINPLESQEVVLEHLDTGFYTIVAKYKGDKLNTAARDTDYFFVKPIEKTETKLTVTAEDIFVEENLKVAINLEGNNPTGNITVSIYNGLFVIDEKIVPVTTKSVVFENLTTGTYHVTARYDGDKYNTRATDRDFFIVKEIPQYETSLNVETENIVEGETLIVNINLNASETATGDIFVGVYNGITLIDNRTVSLETRVVPFNNLTAGTYHIYASYSGDKYNTASRDYEFFIVKNVPQTETNLTVTAESITEGEDLEIEIDFEAINPTNNLTINVFDGIFLIKSFNVAPDTKFVTVENLTVGTYHITARYEGDKYNTAAVNRSFFAVKPVEKTDINLTVNTDNIEEGEDLEIEIIMDEIETDEKLTVTVYDGLSIFNEYTVDAESQNIPVYNLKAGVYHVVVSFPGDEEYYSASKTKFVYVAKHEEETDIAA